MAYVVRMPDLGLSRDPVTLRAWLVDPGDRVETDTVLAEVTTDGVTAELDAREPGIVREIYREPGASVDPGSPLAIVADPDEDIAQLTADVERAGIAGAQRPTDTTATPPRHATAVSDSGMTGTVSVGALTLEYASTDASDDVGDQPSPVTIFLGGFAACLSLSIRYQADMRNADVERIEVTADASPETGTVETIDLTVTLDAPDVADDVLARIVENGERTCHVSELLREDLPIDLTWDRPA